MATITGTTGSDTLFGTPGDDLIQGFGGSDTAYGGGGNDIYEIYQGYGSHELVIEDGGGSGADRITGVRALFTSASLGFSAWATAEHVGDDLLLWMPNKPYRFRHPGHGSATIEIHGHYAGDAVEEIEIGGTTYQLATGGTGTDLADIIAGTARRDVIEGLDGGDFIDANAGNDRIDAGLGDDIIFGDAGRDRISGGDGLDRIYGGDDDDRVFGGAGSDQIYGGTGNNRIVGGSGNDVIFSGSGDDTLKGKAGQDLLVSGGGDDLLSGGRGGDRYRIGADYEAGSTSTGWGHDVIVEKGERPRVVQGPDGEFYQTHDVLELYALYGPSTGYVGDAIASIATARIGDDMVISTIDQSSSVTVTGGLGAGWKKAAIETVQFHGGYWTPLQFVVTFGGNYPIGDDRGQIGLYNEMIFGSDQGEAIFGDSGLNLIWTGDGADTLIYKESEPLYGEYSDGYWPTVIYSWNAVVDTVMDFDPAQDRFDFSEMGITMADLSLGSDAEGDATIAWSSPSFDIASIFIELRGVDVAELTADHFIF